MNLSDEAKSALINAPSGEPGQRLRDLTPAVYLELVKEKAVTHSAYLTSAGSIERERLMLAAEAKAFGA
jgi:hypothetical protein